MRALYKYLYIHLYKLTSKKGRRNTKYGALMYLNMIFICLALPIEMVLFSRVIRFPNILFIIVSGVFVVLLYLINKRIIYNRKAFKEALLQFNAETRSQKTIGYAVSLLLLISSPVLFVLIMWGLVQLT